MADERPIVVLGGGINGAAVARELTLSAAPVVVVEADDIASGTTAWSTRLIHGGLRYLEYGEVGLVRESLAERDRLVRLAPHLVTPLPFAVPVRGRLGGLAAAAARLLGWEVLAGRWRPGRGRGAWTVGAGLAVYDLLAAGSGWPRHRTLRSGGARLPAVDRGRFPFVCTYTDAQVPFPERLTVELFVDARQAAAERGVPFELHTHCRATVLADGRLRLTAATDGVARELWPAAIINATGAWVDRTLAEIPGREPPPAAVPLVGGTKGSHLVLRAPLLRAALAGHGVYAEADDGRPVFVLPFGRELVLVGTTDIPFTGDPAAARADAEEIDYLLAAAAVLFPQAAPGRDAVQQHYCGVRPLPAAGAASKAAGAITRRHMIVRETRAPVPTWSLVGGKLTTCRSLAETTAAEVLAALGRAVSGSSRERPLPGACVGPTREAAVRATAAAARCGLDEPRATAAAERLVGLFGGRAPAVLAERAGGPAPLWGTDLPAAAVAFAVREEWARSLDDLVERRLMLVFEPGLCRGTLTDVATVLAEVGLLSTAAVAATVAACAARLEARYDRRLAADPPPPERLRR